jgi:hypothetical protein
MTRMEGAQGSTQDSNLKSKGFQLPTDKQAKISRTKERKARGVPGRPQQLQTEIKVTTRIIYCGM